MEGLVTALPKGRLMQPIIKILQEAKLISKGLDINTISRELIYKDTGSNNSYLLAKPKDVPAYVEHGAADIGITGKDVISEHGRSLYELHDLGTGACRLVVAVKEESNITAIEDIPKHSRVATSYPSITRNFFKEKGLQVDIIHLNGSVELAPAVGLADLIVDITSTGTTLRKNKLLPIAEIMRSTARLIVNNVSYKTKYDKIIELLNNLKSRGSED